MEGLNWQTLQYPLAAGLNTKPDPRALQAPELTVLKDAQFDDLGGLQTRKPYEAMSASIFGGGTLSNVRRLVVNGDEFLLFTKDALYSWNAQLSVWVLKGTHLAIKTSEASRFVNTAEQFDGDRAELSGTVVYVWTQAVGAASRGYVAALDKTTGNVLMTPTALAADSSRLRVTALSTKILLTFCNLSPLSLEAYALDPASPATALSGASTILTNASFNTYYDIVRIGTTDQAVFAARENPTTSYTVGTVTAALVVNKMSKVRSCDGPIAVSAAPNGTQVQVIRGSGTNIQGDLITLATLADVYTAQAIGTAGALIVNQITCAHRSVLNGGQYRCYAFWSYAQSAASITSFGTKHNWVDTGNALGTQANFVNTTGLASRAFNHDGSVYVWIVFAVASLTTEAGGTAPQVTGLLQNTYFMYRDDGLLTAKAATAIAGGYATSTGALPNVATTGTNAYAWAGIERRAIELGNNLSGYSARAPRDIGFEFDTNDARRCARLGKTLYITGGEIMQYDGAGLYEVGFHIYPWYLDMTDFVAGALAAGDYGYKMTWRWDNAQGERERSTTATAGLLTMAASRKASIVPWHALNITHKTANPPAAELWRTAVNPTDDAPFYLVTKSDPTQTAGDNRYLANDNTAFGLAGILDNYADSTATNLETNPENGLLLESMTPPAATLIAATDTRMFLAGIAGEPDRVAYSKQRSESEVVAFHEALVVSVPKHGGDITGIAIAKNGTPVVFRETATYVLLADGYDNAGNGQNYIAREVSADYGATSQESIAVTDRGVVFKSSRGWCLMNEAFQVEYIGGPVADFDSEAPLAVNVIESQHQLRILTASRMLVLDTLANQWAEWTISGGLHACIWNGAHTYLSTTAPQRQRTDFTGVNYGMDVELAFIRPAGHNARCRVSELQVLGEFRSTCTVRVRLARDDWKDGVDTYFQDKSWTPSPAIAGAPLAVKHGPKIQELSALKVRITISGATGEGVRLTALSLKVGIKQGLNSQLAAAQRQ